jgi:peroxiredoxin
MKNGLLFSAFACILLSSAQAQERSAYQIAQEAAWKKHPTLALGAQAPDFSLTGTDGKKHSLAEFKRSRILAVIFTCDHCPTAQMYEDRIKTLVTDYRSKGVAFVAIQPNASQVLAPGENNYTDVADTLDDMKIRAKYRRFNFPYLNDGETQTVSAQYGPRNTPHLFLFDKERKLRYEGRIDDNQFEARAKIFDAREALDALVAGKEVPNPKRAVFGCSIKWKEQTERKALEWKQWQETPVTLEAISADGLKKLRANPTGKTLMINFWATWCGPCIAEFDDMLETHMWFRSREFELITVSTDTPEAKAAVVKFLNEHHSAVKNYQFASDDVYALQEAFDKRWDSGVPYTVVLAPDGRIVYEETGEVSVLNMRRAILGTLPEGGWIGNDAYWKKALAEAPKK